MKINQYQKIIKLLEEAGDKGINSLDTRAIAVQLPARIFYLKKAPYNLHIESVPQHDKHHSVNYVLRGKLVNGKTYPVEQKTTWVYEGNTAREVPLGELEPRQEGWV